MRPPAACTASASASSTRCRPRRSSRSRANKKLYRQTFAKRRPTSARWRKVGAAPNRRGTTVAFTPDPEIFGEDAKFKPARLYRLARSKAYLFAGVEIRWRCDPALASATTRARRPCSSSPAACPTTSRSRSATRECATAEPFAGGRTFPERPGLGRMGGRLAAVERRLRSIIATPSRRPTAAPTSRAARRADQGHPRVRRAGRQQAAKDITADDVMAARADAVGLHPRPAVPEPDQGPPDQPDAARFVEAAVRDHFDHFLADNMDRGRALLGFVVERMDERLKRRAEREVKRKTATSARKLRLPGKLTDCANDDPAGHRAVHRRGRQRRRLGQAGARPQDAGDPADPRQDPQRRLRHRRQDPRQPGDRRPHLALGCGTRDRCDEARCATSGSSS
jgi:topoisomerase-4 subunit B